MTESPESLARMDLQVNREETVKMDNQDKWENLDRPDEMVLMVQEDLPASEEKSAHPVSLENRFQDQLVKREKKDQLVFLVNRVAVGRKVNLLSLT